MVNATQTENRTEYACRPTNEDSLAAFLVDRNDYHFFNRDILEKNMALATFFIPDAIDATNSFWLITYHEESF